MRRPRLEFSDFRPIAKMLAHDVSVYKGINWAYDHRDDLDIVAPVENKITITCDEFLLYHAGVTRNELNNIPP